MAEASDRDLFQSAASIVPLGTEALGALRDIATTLGISIGSGHRGVNLSPFASLISPPSDPLPFPLGEAKTTSDFLDTRWKWNGQDIGRQEWNRRMEQVVFRLRSIGFGWEKNQAPFDTVKALDPLFLKKVWEGSFPQETDIYAMRSRIDARIRQGDVWKFPQSVSAGVGPAGKSIWDLFLAVPRSVIVLIQKLSVTKGV